MASRLAAAAWSYPDALPESARLAGYVSFDPGLTQVSPDGGPLRPAAYQEVVSSGTDRDLGARPDTPGIAKRNGRACGLAGRRHAAGQARMAACSTR